MCRIDIQLKKIIRLKYFILETPYAFFSIFSWFFSFTHLTLYHLCFLVLTTTTFPFLAFPTFPFVFLFYKFKKEKIILNIFNLILFQVKTFLVPQQVFFDYQINLENTADLNSSL